MLGVADRSVLYDLVRALIAGDAATVPGIVGDLADEGYDLATVARDFLACCAISWWRAWCPSPTSCWISPTKSALT